jgi:hypothetical protein
MKGVRTRSHSLNRLFARCRLIYVPEAVAAALYKSIGGVVSNSASGEYTVPCGSTFKTIALSFGGVQYQMPLSDVFLGCEFRGMFRGWGSPQI